MSYDDDAVRAAEKSGVVIRELRQIGEFAGVYRLFDDIWRPDPGNPPVTVELMKVISHAGGYVAGAYEGEQLVGASVGLLAEGNTLHSHVTGASIGRGIGYALKLHQRAWCLRRGLDRITWTYDPLVRRNAHFNLVKVGARPQEYLERFYGDMGDAINAGDESDRLLVAWRLERPPATREPYRPRTDLGERPMTDRADGPARTGLGERDGRPVVGRVDGPVVLVGTPEDVEALRRREPATALAWRRAMREVLGGLMAGGGQVTGFTPQGQYVVECEIAEETLPR